MYPTSVPTHSAEIGTSSSSTAATLTTGGGGVVAAPDFSPQPASAAASTMASRRAPTGESFFISLVCTTQPPRRRPACLPREWRPGIRLHLRHHMRALLFDGGLAGAQLAGDLLVEKTGDDPCQHVSLTGSEGRVATTQVGAFAALRTYRAIALDRVSNGVEQILLAERL